MLCCLPLPKYRTTGVSLDENQAGSFCVFTDEFLVKNKSGVALDELPIFKSGGYPVFEITDEKAEEIAATFRKMKDEIASDYEFKYDLLRNYVLELIHYGQKLQLCHCIAFSSKCIHPHPFALYRIAGKAVPHRINQSAAYTANRKRIRRKTGYPRQSPE